MKTSDDDDSDLDSDNGRRQRHEFVVNHETTLPTTGREEARDSPHDALSWTLCSETVGVALWLR